LTWGGGGRGLASQSENRGSDQSNISFLATINKAGDLRKE